MIINKKENLGGFTLIELLVVVAIIGLLASVILALLGAPKNKARDSRIQVDVRQLKSIAESINSESATGYTALCSAGNDLNITSGHNYINQVTTLRKDIMTQMGKTALVAGTDIACQATNSAYCVSVDLKAAGFFCIDSVGLATTTSAIICGTGATPLDCK